MSYIYLLIHFLRLQNTRCIALAFPFALTTLGSFWVELASFGVPIPLGLGSSSYTSRAAFKLALDIMGREMRVEVLRVVAAIERP